MFSTAPPAGLEPATSRLEGSCSIRLSYGGPASGRDAAASVGARRSRTEGQPRQHLVPGTVAALAGQVRGDDGDLRRDPRRAGIRVAAPAPSGSRRPARGKRPRVRCGTNGPPSGAAPATEQADRTPRASRPSASTSSALAATDPRPEHLRPCHVREAPTSATTSASGGVRAATLATASTTSSTTRSGADPMNARVTCHWAERRPPQLRTRRPAHREELVEVLDGILGRLHGHEQSHGGHHPPRAGEWRADLHSVVRLAP